LSGIFFMLLLMGCATTPRKLRLLDAPPGDIQQRVELDDVGFFSQQEYQCGPAALATVLDYQGLDTAPYKLIDRVYIPERKGSLQIEMIATARSHGLLAYKIDPDLSVLLKEIDQGNPVLVFQNLSLASWPQWHYAVVVGYDLSRAELILRSGTIRRHTISFATFERTWQRAAYWAYVLLKPGEIPRTANPVTYTSVSHDLDTSGFKNEALNAFRQGARRWPDNPVVIMALGNSEYAAGNYDSAEKAFEREIKLRADNAAAWNNLAYTFAAKNCKNKAVDAINCAVLIEPNEMNYQQSADEIATLSASNQGSCVSIVCPRKPGGSKLNYPTTKP